MITTDRQDIGQWLVLRMFLVAITIAFISEIGVSAAPLSAGPHTDIEYGRVDGERLLLDAFVPEGDEIHPVVILVHGGGWVGGNKQDMRFLCEPLVPRPGLRVFPWVIVWHRNIAGRHVWRMCKRRLDG